MVGMEYPDEFDEEEIDSAERQADLQDEVYGDTTPSEGTKQGLYPLFWRVVKTKDSSKVGNLKDIELGMLNISVRDAQKIAYLARQLEHPTFAEFFEEQAEIILATSASRNGWLAELFVSQKKMQTRAKRHEIKVEPTTKKPGGLFKKRK